MRPSGVEPSVNAIDAGSGSGIFPPRPDGSRASLLDGALRAALVVVGALVAGVVGAIGATVLHWHVIEPSDAELLSATVEPTPPGFAVDWGPTVSGKWAPSFDRGHVRLGMSSDDDVTIDAVRDDLVATGWESNEPERGRTIDTLFASKDGLLLVVNRFVNQNEDAAEAAMDESATKIEMTLQRGSPTPSLALTIAIGTTLAFGAGVAITLRLTRRRT